MSITIQGRSHTWTYDEESGLLTPPYGVTEIPNNEFGNKFPYQKLTLANSITKVDSYAFDNNSELSKVIIPGSVTEFGSYAFRGCEKLTSVGPMGSGCDIEFGWSTKIPQNAFFGCSSLNKVIIPNSITDAGHLAFADCFSLKTFGPIGGDYDVQVGWTYKIPFTPFLSINSYLTEVTIPDGVMQLDDCLFQSMSKLKKLIIPKSVVSIGEIPFSTSTKYLLKSAGPIGSGCDYEFGWDTEIVSKAFHGCHTIKTIIIPKSITKIAYDAFNNCTLTDVYYGGSKSSWLTVNGNGYILSAGYPTIHYAIADEESLAKEVEILEQLCDEYENVMGTDDPTEAEKREKLERQKKFVEGIIEEEENSSLDMDAAQAAVDRADNLLNGKVDPDDSEEGGTDMPTNATIFGIDETQLTLLVTQVLTKVKEMDAARIVKTLTDAADDEHVPSALAVFTYLKTLAPNFTFQTVTGNIDTEVTNPDPKVIYLQKDSEQDPTWMMYLRVGDQWIGIGDTDIDLSQYWSKEDVDELRKAVLGEENAALIDDLDFSDFLTNDETGKGVVEGWIDGYKTTILGWLKTSELSDLFSDDQLSDLADKVAETDEFDSKVEEKVTEKLGDQLTGELEKKTEDIAEKVVESSAFTEKVTEVIKGNISLITAEQITNAVNAAYTAVTTPTTVPEE